MEQARNKVSIEVTIRELMRQIPRGLALRITRDQVCVCDINQNTPWAPVQISGIDKKLTR